MDDLISRQAALNCFHDWIDRHGDVHTADEMQEYNAIEALPSAQLAQDLPKGCTDTISRQEAIYIASGYCHPANIAKELAKLPSAQRWIPCSERLPNEVRRMSVDEKLALLKTAIARLKEKYCENCQEYDCDYCRFEVDEDEID